MEKHKKELEVEKEQEAATSAEAQLGQVMDKKLARLKAQQELL